MKCIMVNPDDRISIDECLNHPAFESLKGSYDCSKLPQKQVRVKVDLLKLKENGTPKEYSVKSLQEYAVALLTKSK